MNGLTTDIDYLVLGGGPAGCSAALMLLRTHPGARVLLAESEIVPVVRPGEALHAKALQFFNQLGIAEDFQQQNQLLSQGIRSIWGQEAASERHQIFSLQGAGWQIDRTKFHDFLRKCVQQNGGQLQQGARFSGNCFRENDFWKITLECPQNRSEASPTASEKMELRCRVVIDATGRKASFARSCGAEIHRTDLLCGVQRFFTLEPSSSVDTFVQIEAGQSGWWYSALLPDQRMAVTYFSDSDLIREQHLSDSVHWNQTLTEAPYTFSRTRAARPEKDLYVFNAMSQRLSTAAGDGWVAAGDAACAFDPLSGQGMYKALKSGILAAYAAFDLFSGKMNAIEKYNYLLDHEYESYLKMQAANYAAESRWHGATFWQRRFLKSH
ncbi:MAG: NAD(P)/FAD-dependent oxidoreductase [Saprospiraceae bacterium]